MTEPQNGPPEVPLWGPAPAMPSQSAPEPTTQRPMFDLPPSPPPPVPPEPPRQPPVRHPDGADHRGRTTTWLVACGAAVVIVLVLVVVVVTRHPTTSTGSATAAQTGSPIGQFAATEPPSAVPTTASSTSAVPSTTPSTTTDTPTTTVAANARILTGPYGMQVSAPPDWTTKPGTVPSVTEVDNPAVPGQFIRFGAAPPVSSGTLLDTVLQYEQTTPGIGSGYQRVQLTSVAFGSAPEAVEWEFTFGTNQGTRHAGGLYWRINGIEYVLYASSYEADWATTQQAFQAMQATAGPS